MAEQAKNSLPSFDEFAVRVINVLKKHKEPSPKTGKIGKGVFARPFNEAARKVYGEDFDVVAATNALIEQGKLEGHPVKGGFMLYLPGEGPQSKTPKTDDILKEAGLEF